MDYRAQTHCWTTIPSAGTSLHVPIPADHVEKELPRPHVQRLRIPDERQDLPVRLIDIKGADNFADQHLEIVRCKTPLRVLVTALTHPLLEVCEVQLGMMGAVPYQVVPVAPLDPVFTAPAVHRVHLTGKRKSSLVY